MDCLRNFKNLECIHYINWQSKGPYSIHCTSTMWYHTLKERIQTIAHTFKHIYMYVYIYNETHDQSI